MKQVKNIISLTVFLLFLVTSIDSVEIKEPKLEVSSGKMMFTLIKTTMLAGKSEMNGLASVFSGSVNMADKTFDFTASLKNEDFQLSGGYKYANPRMHEDYLESAQYPTAKFVGTILSYDPTTGTAKVNGKMTLHGVTKDNIAITGNVTKNKSGEGYELKSTFKVKLSDYKIKAPDMGVATVSELVELKVKLELRTAK
jgi:polyisoprenoid-binding protein YceI